LVNMVNLKSHPPFSFRCAVIEPPYISVIFLQIESPIPVPSNLCL